MRADRLLSILMLLQARGPMTAHALARALEVSERTIYRDIDALGAAGVPVYAQSGPGGGYGLLESYRTNLTGLTDAEVRALFMLSIPAPLETLGVSQELRAAMLKLSAALPAARRGDEARARQRILLDATWWFQAAEPLPHLRTIHQAVWEDRRLRLTYRVPFEPRGDMSIHTLVDPYGLVAKANVWYLVAARAGQPRVYRVAQVLDAQITSECFEHPASFDLAAFWSAWCAEFERHRSDYPVKVRAAPELLPELRRTFGAYINEAVATAQPDAQGWIVLTLPFERLEAARERLLGFGGAVEVLEPEALRRSLADFAMQIVNVYLTQ